MSDGWLVEQAPDDPLMAVAWRDCLLWAIGDPVCLEQFAQDTGIRYTSPRNPIEAMIDESTGRNTEVARRFVKWFNENVWGDSPTPPAPEQESET